MKTATWARYIGSVAWLAVPFIVAAGQLSYVVTDTAQEGLEPNVPPLRQRVETFKTLV